MVEKEDPVFNEPHLVPEITPRDEFDNRLEAELNNIDGRISEYKERLRSAKKIIIVAGCDDTRVGVSPELTADGVMMLYIPKIGGGIPSMDEIRSVLGILDDWGVTQDRELILTQHGSTAEVQGDTQEASCGLRAKHSELASSFAQEAEVFLKLARENEINSQSSLSEFPDEMMTILQDLSDKTGLPKRLLKIALLNNGSGQITQNANFVEGATQKLLEENEIEITVRSGIFDHNTKNILLTDGSSIDSGTEEWKEDFQDPNLIVISFGGEAGVIHDGVILPNMVGITNNDFSTAAVEDEEHLLDALAEAWYAAHNHRAAKDTQTGKNFVHTDACVIFCDNQQFVEIAKSVLLGEEFATDYAGDYSSLEMGITLINLDTGNQERVFV